MHCLVKIRKYSYFRVSDIFRFPSSICFVSQNHGLKFSAVEVTNCLSKKIATVEKVFANEA